MCNYFKEEGNKMSTWNSIIFQNLNALYRYKNDIKFLFPKENPNLIVLTSDVSTSAGLDRFRKKYLNQYIVLYIKSPFEKL